jgi:predicted flavoprotein YhiN
VGGVSRVTGAWFYGEIFEVRGFSGGILRSVYWLTGVEIWGML